MKPFDPCQDLVNAQRAMEIEGKAGPLQSGSNG